MHGFGTTHCCECGHLLHLISLLGSAAAEAGGRIGVRFRVTPAMGGAAVEAGALVGLWAAAIRVLGFCAGTPLQELLEQRTMPNVRVAWPRIYIIGSP